MMMMMIDDYTILYDQQYCDLLKTLRNYPNPSDCLHLPTPISSTINKIGQQININSFIIPPEGEGLVLKKIIPAEERTVEICTTGDDDDDTAIGDWVPTVTAIDDNNDDEDDVETSAVTAVSDVSDVGGDDKTVEVVSESIMEIVSEETNGVLIDLIDTVSADISDMAVTAEVEETDWWEEDNNTNYATTNVTSSLSVTIDDVDDDDDGHMNNNMNIDSVDGSIVNSNNSDNSSTTYIISPVSSTDHLRTVDDLYFILTKSCNHHHTSNNSGNNNTSTSSSSNGTSSIVKTTGSGKQGRFGRSDYYSQPASLSTSVGFSCNLKNHR